MTDDDWQRLHTTAGYDDLPLRRTFGLSDLLLVVGLVGLFLAVFFLTGCNSKNPAKQVGPSPVRIEAAPALTTRAIDKTGLVVIEFSATWCGRCQRMKPVVEALIADAKNPAKVYEIDIDANQEIAEEQDVHAVPTFILFKDGVELERHSGVCTEPQMLEHIKAAAAQSTAR